MPRARDLGIVIGTGPPGPHNAITDVAGVRVGYTTLIEGAHIRTGVTLILPFLHDEALFAGGHRLNGNGEMTGWHYIREMGLMTSPIAITNTHSVGTVHTALVAHSLRTGRTTDSFTAWSLPVVAETWDGLLNDVNGFHVQPNHVEAAIQSAHSGSIREGNVGGGTGMIAHGFKGGTGTSSRVLADHEGGWTLGVLVQANHGRRARLTVDGFHAGRALGPDLIPLPAGPEGTGSIIVIVATDAPLLPLQCDRVAQRAVLGIGRTGGLGEDSSGDLILCFATGNRIPPAVPEPSLDVRMVPNSHLNPLFAAAADATEEAILNALLAAQTMTGFRGVTAHALNPDLLRSVMAERDTV